MNIVVCIKQVPGDNGVKIDTLTHLLLRQSVPGIINPYDRHALELALRVKEQTGGSVTVLSMGPLTAKEALKECLELGADTAVLLSDPAFRGSDTLATSYVLAAGINRIGGIELIFCGQQATDGNTAQVGPELAEHLGYAQITAVTDVNFQERTLQAICETDAGYTNVEAGLPVVVTVGRSVYTPRCPTVKSVLFARNKPITVWQAGDLAIDCRQVGLQGSPTQVERISYCRQQRKGCEFIFNEEASLTAKLLLKKLKHSGII
ncbi:Electron transfer flavoprotein subunit beta [Propionispora sp. 2/2-37]|uniref:electron transfer flavoprotein subunit beta/FixA family protein n=1 Tax=Propionispora sp. 2/2-37 TaxID=1677858 RepID=UPI0006BB85E4|nr:electron transfer flavoprotein subunit beta/FixA family protein [Propionispora sp. 2/2-37]CUH96896.1 Electron transfer flavoprotein subunit beta [Propionispora sp. 2/2-37]